jgi:hypothetical protein
MANRASQRKGSKTYLLAAIVSSVCLAATGPISLLQAQTAEATKAPLSFYGLGNDQAIGFDVGTRHAHFGAAFLSFTVGVFDQPQPEAKIRLRINASMIIPKIEKEWGHHVGETVTRSLTPADLQTLEKFLTVHRAKGAMPPPTLSGPPTIEFDLITYRTDKDGVKRPDIDKKELYPVSEEAERDFIKNFIGYSEPSN